MDFFIPSQAHNGQASTRDQQQPNNNPAIAHSNSVTAKAISLISKQSICLIKYNSNFKFNSDDNTEFIDIDLPCNKLNIWLLANDSILCTKKRHVLKIENEANEASKVKAIWEEKISIKQVGKKISKALVLIFDLIGKSLLNI